MSSLRKDLRSELERTVVKARDIAEAAATAALQALAVDQPKPFTHMDAEAKALRNRLRERGRAAGDVRNDFTTAQTIGHLAQLVGYEHWHRMLFARFLAENNLLLEPEHQVALSLADVEELAREEGADLWQLAGSYAQRMLPEVFRNDDPALEVTLAREDRVKLEKLLADLDPATFTATDSLGWTYQFWQTKRKGEVNASGVKIGADEISPVTQLFTEDYMVDFLLDNTLGAWHAARRAEVINDQLAVIREEEARAAVALPGCEWKYLRFIQEEPNESSEAPSSLKTENLKLETQPPPRWRPAAGSFDGWPKKAAELKCLDPCMGSGHFVTAMFERLVALRMAEENLSEIDAVRAVIRDNLFGLELDPRCTQIAAFNLALAAWRRVGHCTLPPMNLACSGLAPNATEQEWIDLAGDDTRLKFGMQALHRLFAQAPVLGSLISPKSASGAGFSFKFEELKPLMEKAMMGENSVDAAHELVVTAKGIAKAAEILAGQFTLVATNVPYLGFRNQSDDLRDFCHEYFSASENDLATVFISRCFQLVEKCGSIAVVSPQNWLHQTRYKDFRSKLLDLGALNIIARLGAGAFETISGEVVKASLTVLHGAKNGQITTVSNLDASVQIDITDKAEYIQSADLEVISSAGYRSVPDCRFVTGFDSEAKLLSDCATILHGQNAGDNSLFNRVFWEVSQLGKTWRAYQLAPEEMIEFSGRTQIVRWEEENGMMARLAESVRHLNHKAQQWRSGKPNWCKRGVAVSLVGRIIGTLYDGEIYGVSCGVVIPKKDNDLVAIWEFVRSGEFETRLREIDSGLAISVKTVLAVPFDLAHWQQVAGEKYPDGLPKPFSSDPTQWLFNGHPAGSDQPLHVAVARLLGYRWPRQTGSEFPDCPALGPDGLEPFCDDDGIVCLTPLRGEAKAADRLRKLLDAAYGSAGVPPASQHDASGQDARAPLQSGQDARAPWNERQLLADAGAKATNLEDWLRDEFFEQHCKLFHHRPFLWHLWDGRPDGFHALVNYHRLAAVARPSRSGSSLSPESDRDGLATPDFSTLRIHQGENLPHWHCEQGIYHVVFRLADSVPLAKREEWLAERKEIEDRAERENRELTEHEVERMQFLYSEKIEFFLDSGHGECLLARTEIGDMVASALAHFDGQRYHLHAWCVMPNHVHVLVEPMPGNDLSALIHSWKSFTSHSANKLLGRSGAFWQKDAYNHIIRSAREYQFQVHYIEENPVKAHLKDWQWVSANASRVAGPSRSGSATIPDRDGLATLETLAYAYLGDWIRRQKDDAANNVPGAESRLEAAEALQQELKNILAGEPPYDLFIRWKPLHQQPIGWHPDLNDGIRLNIRPFLYAKDVKKKGAGILRWKPNVKWTKDRGTEPQRPKTDFPWFWTWDEKTPDFPGSHKFDGNRWNDLHYTTATKQAARAAHEQKGTEA